MRDDPTIAPALTRWRPDAQAPERLPAGWRDLLSRDPFLRDVAVVVDIAPAGPVGRSVRVAVRPVRSVDVLGDRYDAVPALVDSPEFEDVLTLGEQGAGTRSVSFSVDALVLEPNEWILLTGSLCGIAELSLERTDVENAYERRIVLLRGDVTAAQFGAVRSDRAGSPDDREIVTLTVADPRESTASPLPPWVLDADRQSAIHSSAVGGTYPIVANSGLRVPTVRLTDTERGSNSFAVAYGELGSVSAVYVNGRAANPSAGVNRWTSEQDVDAFGTPYTQVRFTNTAKKWQDGDTVHATCTALVSDERPVDALRRILARHSGLGHQGLSADLFGSAAARYPAGLGAPRIVVNASGGSEGGTTALEWAESGLFASYPMLHALWYRGAWGPVFVDARDTVMAELVAGTFPVLGRATAVAENPSAERISDVAVSWGYDPMLDTYAGTVVRDATTSRLAALASGVRPRPRVTILSPYLADEPTAAFVAEWLIDHFALGSFSVEYDLAPAYALVVRCGDTVTLTDPDLGWDGARALVERVGFAPGRASATFRVWPTWRDPRPA